MQQQEPTFEKTPFDIFDSPSINPGNYPSAPYQQPLPKMSGGLFDIGLSFEPVSQVPPQSAPPT